MHKKAPFTYSNRSLQKLSWAPGLPGLPILAILRRQAARKWLNGLAQLNGLNGFFLLAHEGILTVELIRKIRLTRLNPFNSWLFFIFQQPYTGISPAFARVCGLLVPFFSHSPGKVNFTSRVRVCLNSP